MKPSLETVAGLYKAACEMQKDAELAMDNILKCAAIHGYSETDLAAELGCPAKTEASETLQ